MLKITTRSFHTIVNRSNSSAPGVTISFVVSERATRFKMMVRRWYGAVFWNHTQNIHGLTVSRDRAPPPNAWRARSWLGVVAIRNIFIYGDQVREQYRFCVDSMRFLVSVDLFAAFCVRKERVCCCNNVCAVHICCLGLRNAVDPIARLNEQIQYIPVARGLLLKV